MVEETMTHGEVIAFLRKRHNIKQADLAREVGVGTQSIVDFEKDRLTLDILRSAIMRLAEQNQEAVAA